MIKYLFILFIFLSNNGFSNEIIPIPAKFLHTIGAVESNNDDSAVGDKGKARGRYQIWQICFKDAQIYDKSLANIPYSAVTNQIIANKVLTAYLNKYCQKEIKQNNFEVMARTWNGGPDGKNKLNTIKYWEKVKNLIDK